MLSFIQILYQIYNVFRTKKLHVLDLTKSRTYLLILQFFWYLKIHAHLFGFVFAKLEGSGESIDLFLSRKDMWGKKTCVLCHNG